LSDDHDDKPEVHDEKPTNIPAGYITLFDAVDLVGTNMFSEQWTNAERDARAPPMSDSEIDTAAFKWTLDVAGTEQDEELGEAGYRKQIEDANEPQRRRWAANEHLRELLSASKLESWALRERRSLLPNPATLWNADFIEQVFISGRVVVIRGANGEVDRFETCAYGAANAYTVVLQEEALKRVLRGEPAQPVVRTGAPGRPGFMHLIQPEHERRADEGIQEPSKTREAECLSKWFEGAHSDLPPVAAKTIYNRLKYRGLSPPKDPK
jgi:hypothetical protein